MTLNLLVWSFTITHLWRSFSTMHSIFISTQLFNFIRSLQIGFTLPVKTIHKINRVLLISLQMWVKSFVSDKKIVPSKIAPRKILSLRKYPPPCVRVRGWFRVRAGATFRGAIFQGAIFLVPFVINIIINLSCNLNKYTPYKHD